MTVGFLILIAAGLCQGSFGLGYKKYNPFSWAAFWGVYNVLCILVASAFTFGFAPRIINIYGETDASNLLFAVFCGALWGLSAVAFSKAIVKIGMSMVYGSSMGVSTIAGSLLPVLLRGGELNANFYIGLILTVLGVAVITAAGVKRDGGAKASLVGIVLSLFSGLGSGAMNAGFASLDGLNDAFSRLGYSGAAVSCGRWLPVLFGGCVMGIIWCASELSIRREWNTLTANGSGRRTVKLLFVSIVWYLALLLYGVATEKLGNLGSSIGWVLFSSLALVVSVFWGLYSGEWRGKKKGLLFVGCAVLVSAWIFIVLA